LGNNKTEGKLHTMFGQIESLVRKIDYSSMKAERSIKKVASTGDPVRQASLNNQGAGSVNMTANLEQEKRYKRGSLNAFQNAMTFMQAQAEAIGQADKIYSRMRTLAQQATDPMINEQDREILSDQFNSLREEARTLGNAQVYNNFLFDARAASTKYEINFTSGLTNDSAHDGKVTRNGVTYRFWERTKDVIYNSGKISIDVNGGGHGERYMLTQGDRTIFDTGIWETKGSALKFDYDRFIVEWGPGEDTTFQFKALSDGNSSEVDLDGPDNTKGTADDGVLPADSTFDNKSGYKDKHGNPTGYLIQLGVNDDGSASGVESIASNKYTTLGQVNAYASDPNSTELTLRIESESLFQIDSNYELPTVSPDYVATEGNLQVELHKLGIGLLLENDQGNNFPPISIDTFENAEKAIVSMSNELEGLGKQLGVLASNVSRVQNAIQTNEGLEGAHESVLSEIGAENFTQDLLELSKARINRAQDTALLTQAMSIHQDLVNVLI
jgi:flagellin-like hook-associated protein FlgL